MADTVTPTSTLVRIGATPGLPACGVCGRRMPHDGPTCLDCLGWAQSVAMRAQGRELDDAAAVA